VNSRYGELRGLPLLREKPAQHLRHGLPRLAERRNVAHVRGGLCALLGDRLRGHDELGAKALVEADEGVAEEWVVGGEETSVRRQSGVDGTTTLRQSELTSSRQASSRARAADA
jgi:hypothetical protein